MSRLAETTLRYTYRLRPGAQAERALWQEWGRNRWLWNQACARRKSREPRRDDKPPAHTGAAIGIDWGVSTVATTTDPAYDLPAGEPEKRAAQRLAGYQRMMSRRHPTPGKMASGGYRDAKRLAAKTAKKVQRQRKDAAVKWSHRVVADHSVIAVEDSEAKFLAKSTMARKAADNGIGLTKRELVECATRAGREVVLIKPAYTTMTCSRCGTRAKDRLLLSPRTFWCGSCGYTDGRDRNAARTILAAAGQYRADVETVRHSDLPSGEERVLVESGIPRL